MNYIKTIECLDANLAEAEIKLKEIKHFEIDPDDWEDQYREMLNESGEINICGFMYDPADALERLDPTAFRCGLLDYVDGIDRSEDTEFKDLLDDLDEIRGRIADAVDYLEEMRDEDDNEDPADDSIEETLAMVDAAIERGTEVLQEIDSL